MQPTEKADIPENEPLALNVLNERRENGGPGPMKKTLNQQIAVLAIVSMLLPNLSFAQANGPVPSPTPPTDDQIAKAKAAGDADGRADGGKEGLERGPVDGRETGAREG